jgi:hypothetical protein
MRLPPCHLEYLKSDTLPISQGSAPEKKPKIVIMLLRRLVAGQ